MPIDMPPIDTSEIANKIEEEKYDKKIVYQYDGPTPDGDFEKLLAEKGFKIKKAEISKTETDEDAVKRLSIENEEINDANAIHNEEVRRARNQG